jgi:DNA-binding GntR family transcriptional regulator
MTGAAAAPNGRPVTRGEAIAHTLRQDILYGNLRPHQRLTQDNISELFQVSRMPARDAMRYLLVEGLLYQDEKVVRVSPTSESEIAELYRIAGVLHGMAAGCAARVCDAALAHELTTGHNRIRRAFEAGGVEQVEWCNWDLHRLINTAGTSVRLRSLLSVTMLPAVRPTDLASHRESILADHAEIVQCIIERDVHGAERAAYEHIFRASGETINILTAKGLLTQPRQPLSSKETPPQALFGFSY